MAHCVEKYTDNYMALLDWQLDFNSKWKQRTDCEGMSVSFSSPFRTCHTSDAFKEKKNLNVPVSFCQSSCFVTIFPKSHGSKIASLSWFFSGHKSSCFDIKHQNIPWTGNNEKLLFEFPQSFFCWHWVMVVWVVLDFFVYLHWPATLSARPTSLPSSILKAFPFFRFPCRDCFCTSLWTLKAADSQDHKSDVSPDIFSLRSYMHHFSSQIKMHRRSTPQKSVSLCMVSFHLVKTSWEVDQKILNSCHFCFPFSCSRDKPHKANSHRHEIHCII